MRLQQASWVHALTQNYRTNLRIVASRLGVCWRRLATWRHQSAVVPTAETIGQGERDVSGRRLHTGYHDSSAACYQFLASAYYMEAQAASTKLLPGEDPLTLEGGEQPGLYRLALLANFACDLTGHLDHIRDVLFGAGWQLLEGGDQLDDDWVGDMQDGGFIKSELGGVEL